MNNSPIIGKNKTNKTSLSQRSQTGSCISASVAERIRRTILSSRKTGCALPSFTCCALSAELKADGGI